MNLQGKIANDRETVSLHSQLPGSGEAEVHYGWTLPRLYFASNISDRDLFH